MTSVLKISLNPSPPGDRPWPEETTKLPASATVQEVVGLVPEVVGLVPEVVGLIPEVVGLVPDPKRECHSGNPKCTNSSLHPGTGRASYRTVEHSPLSAKVNPAALDRDCLIL